MELRIFEDERVPPPRVSEMASAGTSSKAIGAPGRWSLHGKTALVTGGTRGIGYDSPPTPA
jgi:hypothetical protein